ncbi:zinc transporter ZIP1-like [Myzus persicae]|uniref:zinc transporter ZIP1-like n=1 Tax=Myzus persicae TaxID=13164 RepID=UPI000B93A075|nr:zinc transporter ZIP1-like [Myzus persicae]
MDSNVAISPADQIAAAKASVALVMSLCSFAIGLLPLKFADRWRSSTELPARISRIPTVASMLLCFGGGVLLFITLLHMQPDVWKSVRVLQVAGQLPTTDHLSDLIFCAGFFAAFIIDETVNKVRSRGHRTGTLAATAFQPSPKLIRGLFAVMALSFHEAFAGLSFGLQSMGPDDGEWGAYATVAASKLIVAFCLSLELAWSGARNPAIVACSAVFAIVTPVGVAVGMALTQCCTDVVADHSPSILYIVSLGLASGSLAFLVFSEVMPRHKQTGFMHLLFTVVGFCVMLLLQISTHYQQYT